jgi:hypothetical protein
MQLMAVQKLRDVFLVVMGRIVQPPGSGGREEIGEEADISELVRIPFETL